MLLFEAVSAKASVPDSTVVGPVKVWTAASVSVPMPFFNSPPS